MFLAMHFLNLLKIAIGRIKSRSMKRNCGIISSKGNSKKGYDIALESHPGSMLTHKGS
jgi:hypothetical protein